MSFKIEVLPARHGDCIWIEYGTEEELRRVLIDGGPSSSYEALRQRILSIPENEREFELLVITHIDGDHIEGILKLLSNPKMKIKVNEVWFNGWRHLPESNIEEFGPVQGERLTTLLEKMKDKWNRSFKHGSIQVPTTGPLPKTTLEGDMELTILSPYKEQLAMLRPVWEKECKKAGLDPNCAPEIQPDQPAGYEIMGPPNIDALSKIPYVKDDSKANGSSIAMLAEYGNKAALFGGDAYPDVLLESIIKLKNQNAFHQPDAFKLPHHGSKHNINKELLEEISCKKYIISTSGDKFQHPDLEAIARLIAYGGKKIELFFNYTSKRNLIWNDQTLTQRYQYSTHFPETDKTGQTIVL